MLQPTNGLSLGLMRVVLPYDPTSSTPVCLVALNSKTQGESVLYDTARYQVRMMIMSSRGANA